jgi:large-conductance mechanosensitive channel
MNDGISSLKKFVVDNNIVGTSAGVCVALAAKDGIESLVGDIIIPTIIIILHALNIDGLAKYLPVKGTELNINSFVKQMITFFLIIIISFLFVQFAFGYLLGITNTKKTDNNTVVNAAAVNSTTKETFFNYDSNNLWH